MKLPKGLRRRRGVALILALLTTVILVTLSLAFMSLSLSEARTSRSYGYVETSVQAASYGLEYALTYMGRGTVPGVKPPTSRSSQPDRPSSTKRLNAAIMARCCLLCWPAKKRPTERIYGLGVKAPLGA